MRYLFLMCAPFIFCSLLQLHSIYYLTEFIYINYNSELNNSFLFLLTKKFKNFKIIILIYFSIMVLATVYYWNKIIFLNYFSFLLNVTFYKNFFFFWIILALFYYILRLLLFTILILEDKTKVQYLPNFTSNWFSDIKIIIELNDFQFYINFFLIIIPLFFIILCYYIYMFIL